MGGQFSPSDFNRLRLCRAVALLALMAAVSSTALAAPAHADSGSVYSCTVHPTYQHPATGTVEDSGGSSSAATGQAMVESCVSKSGMMEVTDAGACYLTIRLSLIDLTSGHQFQVQDWGGAGWSTPALGVTATGADSNGTTNDVCIGLPSQRGIVRISMHVESMGRDVVFYAYADGLASGAPPDFTPTIVTEAPAVQVAAPEAGETPVAGDAASAPLEDGGAVNEEAVEAESAAQAAEDLVEASGAPSAQGLSLSTAPEDAGGAVDPVVENVTGASAVAMLALAAFAVGTGLMLVAAVIVYVFRRNWARWGGSDPDDYGGEYRDA